MIYEAHVAEIIRASDLKRVPADSPKKSWANRFERSVCIPDNLATETEYAIAMHELGHIHGSGQEDYDRLIMNYRIPMQMVVGMRMEGWEDLARATLASEFDAWVWAYQNMKVWTDKIDFCARDCIATYFNLCRVPFNNFGNLAPEEAIEFVRRGWARK